MHVGRQVGIVMGREAVCMWAGGCRHVGRQVGRQKSMVVKNQISIFNYNVLAAIFEVFAQFGVCAATDEVAAIHVCLFSQYLSQIKS